MIHLTFQRVIKNIKNKGVKKSKKTLLNILELSQTGQELVRHRVQFQKISRERNFGGKNVGRIRTFEDHRERQRRIPRAEMEKLQELRLSPRSYAVSGISCLFEKFSNFMQMQRRGGTATGEDALRYREFEYSLLFLPSLHHSRGYTASIYCFVKETGAWNARVKLLWHTFPRIN